MDTGLRTSTNTAGGGVISFFVIWGLNYFAPGLIDSAPGDPVIVGGMITGAFMWVAARISKAGRSKFFGWL